MNPKWKYVKSDFAIALLPFALFFIIYYLPYILVVLGIIFILREEFK
jgi:hypothetical protein